MGTWDLGAAKAALLLFDVDERGLDRLDRAVLNVLVKGHGGRPVGVSTLAIAVGEEPSTVEEVCEPYLVRAGMIARTGRGPGCHCCRVAACRVGTSRGDNRWL